MVRVHTCRQRPSSLLALALLALALTIPALTGCDPSDESAAVEAVRDTLPGGVERKPMFVQQVGYLWDGVVHEAGRIWTSGARAVDPAGGAWVATSEVYRVMPETKPVLGQLVVDDRDVPSVVRVELPFPER